MKLLCVAYRIKPIKNLITRERFIFETADFMDQRRPAEHGNVIYLTGFKPTQIQRWFSILYFPISEHTYMEFIAIFPLGAP